jgi:hypothetical protein
MEGTLKATTAQEIQSATIAVGPQETIFYSRIPRLLISPPGMKGKPANDNGIFKHVGEKLIQFVPLGSEHYGQYVTSDPELIDYLERRCRETGDVMTAQEFEEASTPASVLLNRAREENRRLIVERNRLLEMQQQK